MKHRIISFSLVYFLIQAALQPLPFLSAQEKSSDTAEEGGADESRLWDNPELVTVTTEEAAFTHEEFEHVRNQSVFAMAQFDNGWVLMMSFFGVKAGVVNNWGIYVGVSDPEGNGYFYKYKIRNRDIQFSEDRLYVTDGVNIVRGENGFYNFAIDIDGFSCNLTYLNILPEWKPGDGLDYYDEEKTAFDQRAVISPWANVQGRITVNGTSMSVTGEGFAEKQLTINPFTKLNPLTYTLRLFSPPEVPREERWHLGLLENYTHEDYGYDRLPRLNLAKGTDWIFTSQNYTVEAYDFRSHPDVPHKYPARLKISCSENGYTLEGTYSSTHLFNVTDIIGELPKFLQRFVLLFMDRPVYYRCIGEFYGIITFPNGEREFIRLLGPYEYIIVK